MKKKRIILALLCFFIALNLISILSSVYFVSFSLSKITGAGSLTGVIRLFIENRNYINVTSPQNISYNFSVGDNYTIDLNVTSNFEVVSWWYTLEDLKHNRTIHQNISFYPNTTINATRWANRLIVYANSSVNEEYNKSVEFFVFVRNSAPLIRNISSQIYVCENDFLSDYFNVTDVDEDTPSASINPSVPFYVARTRNFNWTSNIYEIYSGKLSKNYVGGANAGSKTYEENISVSDGEYADSSQVNITIIEINTAPSINEIGVHTIWGNGTNRTFYHQAIAADIEDGNQDSGNLTFNITILNSTGSIVDLFNISSTGIMNFTANTSQIGIYNITVYAADLGLINPHPNITSICGESLSNKTSNSTFSLIISNENRYPVITTYYPSYQNFSVYEGILIYFNVSMYDPDGAPLDTYWYVDDGLVHYDSAADSGGGFSTLSYIFDYQSSGKHSLTARVTDGALNSSFTWNLTVLDSAIPSAPVSAGGGSGGLWAGKLGICEEKWGCEDWNTCENLKESLNRMRISEEDYWDISKICELNNWGEKTCGVQFKICVELNDCNTTKNKPIETRECYFTEHPDCYDKITNCHDGACEILADCGGPCAPCPTCSDNLKNQGEEGTDCGGPCPRCAAELPIPKNTFRYLLIALIALLVLILFIIFIIRRRRSENEKV